ncbi:hypothetical protein BGZ47_009476 [Haplosporangium gracile]|nr:hypothetical protein BGZ47_009476 [Haplosporangium gracile]
MDNVRMREIEGLIMMDDGLDNQHSLVDRYRSHYYKYPGLFDGLEYIDILNNKGPNELTLESVWEILDSGEYKDLFVDHIEEDGVGEGEVIEDTPLPAGDNPTNLVIEKEG